MWSVLFFNLDSLVRWTKRIRRINSSLLSPWAIKRLIQEIKHESLVNDFTIKLFASVVQAVVMVIPSADNSSFSKEARVARVSLGLGVSHLHFFLWGRHEPGRVPPRPNGSLFPKQSVRLSDVSVDVITQPNEHLWIELVYRFPNRLCFKQHTHRNQQTDSTNSEIERRVDWMYLWSALIGAWSESDTSDRRIFCSRRTEQRKAPQGEKDVMEIGRNPRRSSHGWMERRKQSLSLSLSFAFCSLPLGFVNLSLLRFLTALSSFFSRLISRMNFFFFLPSFLFWIFLFFPSDCESINYLSKTESSMTRASANYFEMHFLT